jgi:hypothetical protein
MCDARSKNTMIKIERILETDWTQAYNVVGYIDADHAVSVEVRREKTRGEWCVGFNWAGYGSHDVRYADAMIAVLTQAKTLAEALEQGDFEMGDTLALVLE